MPSRIDLATDTCLGTVCIPFEARARSLLAVLQKVVAEIMLPSAAVCRAIVSCLTACLLGIGSPASWDVTCRADDTSTGAPAGTTDGSLSIVSEGVGTDVEAAKLDAYRNAVRQAVGAYVDATTIVANDKLITDEIVALSGAYVSTAEVLPDSVRKDGPFTRIRVKVQVETGRVLTALQDRKIKTTQEAVAVDATSLLAELDTKADRLGSAERLLGKLFTDYPQKCFRAVIVGQPTPARQDGDNVEIRIRLRIESDPEATGEFHKALTEVLNAVTSAHESKTIPLQPSVGSYFKDRVFDNAIRFATARMGRPEFFNCGRNQDYKVTARGKAEESRLAVCGIDASKPDVLVVDEFSIPDQLFSKFPRLVSPNGLRPPPEEGVGYMGFELVAEGEKAEPISLVRGACYGVGCQVMGRQPALMIAPGMFVLGYEFATAVEATLPATVNRSTLADGIKIRCTLSETDIDPRYVPPR